MNVRFKAFVINIPDYEEDFIKRGGSAMAWIIKAYIPVEPEDPETYATKEEVEKDVESLSLMQPENIYEIEELEDK